MSETNGRAGGVVETTYVEDELKESYLDYAMSVIVGRALPDVRDGLKPVHRRILHAMNERAWRHDRPFVKSAKVVGEVIGNFHPHGDQAVYDTLVRMAQDFALRYPLVEGQGNFGSIDGDPPAAYRYTEARLARIADEILADIEKETVPYASNFDGTQREPTLMPARLPNLLVNGSAGIAVGMATNIPPHNLNEVCDAIEMVIERPDVTAEEIEKVMPGPDFPTGGVIFGREGIREYYRTGRGRLTVGAVAAIEEAEGRSRIVVTEIPYQVNKAAMLERIADLVRDKKIEGIADLRDESDRDGMRIVIELKKDAVARIVLNQLQKHTQLLETYGVILLALSDGRPRVFEIVSMLRAYVEHRKEVIRRRSAFLLKNAEAEAHIREGLIKALGKIDDVIEAIRKAKDRPAAHESLMKKFAFTDVQAKAILEMRLHRLTTLEIQEERAALANLLKEIERLKHILAHDSEILRLIREDLADLKKRYGDARRTRIVDEAAGEYDPEDLIQKTDAVVTISHAGYVKRQPVAGYRTQRRGGRGVIAASTGRRAASGAEVEAAEGAAGASEDFVEHLFIASTHDYILFLTEKGRCHWLKVYDVPEAGRAARGRSIRHLVPFQEGDRVAAVLPVDRFDEERSIVFATANGMVKRSRLSDFSRPRPTGIIAITLDEGDRLIEAHLADETSEIVIATRDGAAIRFPVAEVRPMGRAAGGIRGITIEKGDSVVGMVSARPGVHLLVATEKGFGKRTGIEEYRTTHRGGKGVLNVRVSEKTGKVVALRQVTDEDQLMVATSHGIVIRVSAAEIRETGRAAQGVRIIRLEEGDDVSDVTVIPRRGEGED